MKSLSFLRSVISAAALQYWRLWQIWLYCDWKIWGLWSEAIHNSLRTVMINHLPLPYKPLSHQLWSNVYIKHIKSLQLFGEIGTHCHIKQTLWNLTKFQIHAVPKSNCPISLLNMDQQKASLGSCSYKRIIRKHHQNQDHTSNALHVCQRYFHVEFLMFVMVLTYWNNEMRLFLRTAARNSHMLWFVWQS